MDGRRRLTVAERDEIYRRVGAGERPRAVARSMGRPRQTIHALLRQRRWLERRYRTRTTRFLSLAEREEVSRGLTAHESLRSIARRLERAPSTISREVARNGRVRYRAWRAEQGAAERGRRPKSGKLAANVRLRVAVEAMLRKRWSPEQIARRLRRDHPNDSEMWVSHETIYKSIYVQGRGELRRELARCLRSGRAQRRPRGRVERRGTIPNMVMISERPAEVNDRAVPGHWEGDLIIGKDNKSAIATLVERSTRYVMLARVADQRAETVRQALLERVATLPDHLWRSLTWDQGREMVQHQLFTIDTGIDVFFCDPHSPWQRGSNENTNGLLRQYFPKGTSLRHFTQEHLDAVAVQLNGRPRETLDWQTPAERLAPLVATTD